MTSAPIPQTDPRAGYLANRAEIDAALARVLQSGRYILGPEVEAFEEAFAAYLGVGHVVGVASGTDAIALGLRALGIGPGDAVATVSHTAVATVAAIELAGASPILVDVEAGGFTMDAERLAAALAAAPRPVRAVIPVHLYGQPADMAAILAVAASHGAAVLEDAAQAHGASIAGRQAGALGDLGAFSFYPTKNLGGLGDGGAVAMDDAGLAERARALRQYGWDQDRNSRIAGMNSRLDAVQAAILKVGLTRLDDDNRRRVSIADTYDRGLADLPLVLPGRRAGRASVFHQYVIRTCQRDRLREELGRRGIGTAVHYASPIHLQPAYAGRVVIGPGGLARTEALCQEILSLPIYPQLSHAAVAQVIKAIRDCF